MAELTRRALGRATLARQMLLERSARGVLEAVEHLVGLQAQAPFPPYYALWSRLSDFGPERLAELVTDRSVVRIALMRSTVHLVSAADARLLRPLTQPAMVRAVRGSAWGRQIAHIDPDEIAAATRAELAAAPLTGSEIGTRLAARWPGAPAQALAIMARVLVPQVQVPPRGVWGATGQARLTTLGAWLGAEVDPAPSVDAVVLRYLGAFGPASVADAQAWSGMTGLAEVFERLAPRLATFRGPGSAPLHDLPDAPRPEPDTPAPVRYTAEWDNLCLSHADRERVVADDDRRRWWSTNGIIPGMVLVDGVAAAAWRIGRARGAATLTVTPFRPVPREHLDEVHAEGAALLRFAAPGATHDVRVARMPG
jgi:hypothetical protein